MLRVGISLYLEIVINSDKVLGHLVLIVYMLKREATYVKEANNKGLSLD